jgi:hypothetical protein
MKDRLNNEIEQDDKVVFIKNDTLELGTVMEIATSTVRIAPKDRMDKSQWIRCEKDQILKL